jgi:hypothetical protein
LLWERVQSAITILQLAPNPRTGVEGVEVKSIAVLPFKRWYEMIRRLMISANF